MYYLDRDIEKYPISDKIEIKKLINEDVSVEHLYFLPGAIESSHENESDEYMFIISGKFEFNVSGSSHVVDKNDTVFISTSSSHSLFCLEKGEILSFKI